MNETILHIVNRSLVRQKNKKIVISLVLLIWTVCGAVAAFMYLPEKQMLSVGVLSGFSGALGILLFRDAIRDYKKMRNFWEDFLHFDYYRVVWVYYRKVENMPFGVKVNQRCRLFLCLDNREKLVIPMKESEISEALFWFQRLLPTSTFGYTTSKEQLYNIGPDLLINSKK